VIGAAMTAARNGIAARMKRVAYMVLDGSWSVFFWGKGGGESVCDGRLRDRDCF
jgi:hypothetical protein